MSSSSIPAASFGTDTSHCDHRCVAANGPCSPRRVSHESMSSPLGLMVRSNFCSSGRHTSQLPARKPPTSAFLPLAAFFDLPVVASTRMRASGRPSTVRSGPSGSASGAGAHTRHSVAPGASTCAASNTSGSASSTGTCHSAKPLRAYSSTRHPRIGWDNIHVATPDRGSTSSRRAPAGEEYAAVHTSERCSAAK
eukprot:1179795-Prorocentrum_minimum.AAC.6